MPGVYSLISRHIASSHPGEQDPCCLEKALTVFVNMRSTSDVEFRKLATAIISNVMLAHVGSVTKAALDCITFEIASAQASTKEIEGFATFAARAIGWTA